MHDLNRNAKTWEFSGCHVPIIRAEKIEKYIVSSSFPNIYSQFMNCTWRIQAPLGKQVKITFPEFKIDNCGAAGLKIYDGLAKTENFQIEHCGSQRPRDFTAQDSLITINIYQRQTVLGSGTAVMVGYSYVDVAQPNTKYYQPGSTQLSQHSQYQSQSQQLAPQVQQNTQIYDLFMNQLLESAIQRPAVQPVAPVVPIQTYQQPAPKKSGAQSGSRGGKKAPPKRPQKKKQPKKPTLQFNINGDGVIRDTYDELVEAKMEKKRAERDALKQKLIIIIVVLIVITSGNVWFIWYRWQSSREQNKNDGEVDSDAQSDSERIYSSIGETYSTVNLNPQPAKASIARKPSVYSTVY